MIKQAIQYIIELGNLPEIALTNKRLVDPRYKAVTNDDKTARRLFVTQDGVAMRLGTVNALCTLINRFHEFSDLTADTKIRVTVESNNVVALFQPEETYFTALEARRQIEAVYVPLEMATADLHFDTLSKFVEFLDQHENMITNEEEVRLLTRSLKIVDLREAKLEDKGAYVEIVSSESVKVETRGIKIPKTLTLKLPTGTREYLVENTYLFRIELRPLSFTLIKKEDDGSWEKLFALIMTDLTENLNTKNVLILEGA